MFKFQGQADNPFYSFSFCLEQKMCTEKNVVVILKFEQCGFAIVHV